MESAVSRLSFFVMVGHVQPCKDMEQGRSRPLAGCHFYDGGARMTV